MKQQNKNKEANVQPHEGNVCIVVDQVYIQRGRGKGTVVRQNGKDYIITLNQLSLETVNNGQSGVKG